MVVKFVWIGRNLSPCSSVI